MIIIIKTWITQVPGLIDDYHHQNLENPGIPGLIDDFHCQNLDAFAFLNVFVLGVMPCLAGPLRAAMPCLAGPLGAAGHAVCLAYRSDS